jgi:hypothetical protein
MKAIGYSNAGPGIGYSNGAYVIGGGRGLHWATCGEGAHGAWRASRSTLPDDWEGGWRPDGVKCDAGQLCEVRRESERYRDPMGYAGRDDAL